MNIKEQSIVTQAVFVKLDKAIVLTRSFAFNLFWQFKLSDLPILTYLPLCDSLEQ
jgi:hypothetical protein